MLQCIPSTMFYKCQFAQLYVARDLGLYYSDCGLEPQKMSCKKTILVQQCSLLSLHRRLEKACLSSSLSFHSLSFFMSSCCWTVCSFTTVGKSHICNILPSISLPPSFSLKFLVERISSIRVRESLCLRPHLQPSFKAVSYHFKQLRLPRKKIYISELYIVQGVESCILR